MSTPIPPGTNFSNLSFESSGIFPSRFNLSQITVKNPFNERVSHISYQGGEYVLKSFRNKNTDLPFETEVHAFRSLSRLKLAPEFSSQEQALITPLLSPYNGAEASLLTQLQTLQNIPTDRLTTFSLPHWIESMITTLPPGIAKLLSKDIADIQGKLAALQKDPLAFVTSHGNFNKSHVVMSKNGTCLFVGLGHLTKAHYLYDLVKFGIHEEKEISLARALQFCYLKGISKEEGTKAFNLMHSLVLATIFLNRFTRLSDKDISEEAFNALMQDSTPLSQIPYPSQELHIIFQGACAALRDFRK